MKVLLYAFLFFVRYVYINFHVCDYLSVPLVYNKTIFQLSLYHRNKFEWTEIPTVINCMRATDNLWKVITVLGFTLRHCHKLFVE